MWNYIQWHGILLMLLQETNIKFVEVDMSIRLMTIDDYEKVYELWMSCVGMGLNNLDDSKEGIDKFLQRNPDTCFVAEI